jgi:putative transcriptional regulator
MSRTIKRNPLFVRLRSALEEGIQFARGKAELRVTEMSSQEEFTADKVLQLRRGFNLSQSEFAGALNVSIKTVQSWERGIRHPSQAALRLLQLLNQRPELLPSILSLTADGTQRMNRGGK